MQYDVGGSIRKDDPQGTGNHAFSQRSKLSLPNRAYALRFMSSRQNLVRSFSELHSLLGSTGSVVKSCCLLGFPTLIEFDLD
jgi:hypothetical protein